ncbi:hypothetical protein ACWEVR_33980, partial [Nocardia sp. NPDC003979]
MKKLTTGCEDFLADIQGLIAAATRGENFPKFTWTYDNKAEGRNHGNVKHRITTLGSMQILYDKFERKRVVELVDMLKNHRAIVTTMGETFNAANKKYLNTDQASGNAFGSTGRSTDHWPNIWKEHSTGTYDWKTKDPLAKKPGDGVSFDDRFKSYITGHIEAGNEFSFIDFANIAEMIGTQNGNTFWLAGQWRALAGIWHNSVQTFTDTVGYVFKNQHWQGLGADRAVAFLERYLQATDTLERGIMGMSNLIGDVANFNAFVWKHLPRYDQLTFTTDGEADTVNGDDAAARLPGVIGFWDGGDSTSNNKGYRAGMQQLVGYLPLFTDPNKLAGASGDLPGTYNYIKPSGDPNNNGGNNNKDKDTGNSGGGGGGNSSTGPTNKTDKEANGGKGSGGTPPPTTGGPTGTNTTGQPTGSPAG